MKDTGGHSTTWPSTASAVGNFAFDLIVAKREVSESSARVEPDGTVSEVADDLSFPNGSVVTAGDVLLANETFGDRITAFDIAVDGTPTKRRVWAAFGDLPTDTDTDTAAVLGQVAVGSDGSVLDGEGALWVAGALDGSGRMPGSTIAVVRVDVPAAGHR